MQVGAGGRGAVEGASVASRELKRGRVERG
jgi:hypothetical protein